MWKHPGLEDFICSFWKEDNYTFSSYPGVSPTLPGRQLGGGGAVLSGDRESACPPRPGERTLEDLAGEHDPTARVSVSPPDAETSALNNVCVCGSEPRFTTG